MDPHFFTLIYNGFPLTTHQSTNRGKLWFTNKVTSMGVIIIVNLTVFIVRDSGD